MSIYVPFLQDEYIFFFLFFFSLTTPYSLFLHCFYFTLYLVVVIRHKQMKMKFVLLVWLR